MRYYFLTLILSLSLSVSASDELVVEQTTGETSLTISSIKDITFDGNGVKISFNDNTSVYYAKETLNMIKFNITASSITDVNKNSQSIIVKNNTITINDYNETIKVFNMTGMLVLQHIGPTIDISSLPEGAYIIQANDLISKIIKQ